MERCSRKEKREESFINRRQIRKQTEMEEHILQLQFQLQERERQLNQLALALQQASNLTQPSNSFDDHTLREIKLMNSFTGVGEVTINSFISSTEYYLSKITSQEKKQLATRTIFYEKILGEAKNAVINIPETDNWELIKKQLKLRYRPEIEPFEIYRQINNLRANSVSELVEKAQKIKYKTDELIIYYKDDTYIDLGNVNSLLVNTIKEICQGVLLDKIYVENDFDTIINIMRSRRFENECIRPEFRKFKPNNSYQKESRNKHNSPNSQTTNHDKHDNSGHYKHKHYDRRNNDNEKREENNSDSHNNSNSNNYQNRSGNFRSNNFNNSGQVKSNIRSGQTRRSNRQLATEPMEVDNVQHNHESKNETNQNSISNNNLTEQITNEINSNSEDFFWN